ncbi:MAG: hypothetical protein PHY94_01795 [Candidatus Omnitrophica bacterium]|nr:hypothetical protein [Candidatus Omnitrophota bacterium]
MKAIFKGFIFTLFFVAILSLPCFAQALEVNSLVDQFKQATDLQREQIKKDDFGKDLTASGIVANVEEYNFFNEKKDLTRKYFRVTTTEQKTPSNTTYQVNFLFKDLTAVKDMNKGEKKELTGKIIKILDERLQISLWLYIGELSAEEKELFITN